MKMTAQYVEMNPSPTDPALVRTLHLRDWLLVDVRPDGRVCGMEVLGDHSLDEAFVCLAYEIKVDA